MRWGWALVWLASLASAAEPLVVRGGVLVGAASGREACLVGTSYSPAFGLGFRNLLDAGGDPHRAVGDDLAAVRLMGLDCLRVLVDDAEVMLADGSLADGPHLELLDYLLAAAGAQGLAVVLTPVSFESGLDPAQPA
ncbi:MAG: hypothetical protein HYU66_03615, partial [Armatimonadetes bacterium]|nr:hypothetical protein [Armatimonadota bacterium]